MVQKMIKNIVFDLGMVLVSFNWKEYLDSFNFHSDIKEKMIEKALGNVTVWNEHDRGTLSDEAFIEFASREAPEIKYPLRQYMSGVGHICKEYPYATEWISSLKQRGYQVYILSNYGNTPYKYAQQHFRFLDKVDGAVISSEVKFVKPEIEIYQCLLEKYHLKAEETVFLDDRKDNIEAAEKCGIHGIVFQGYEEGKEELEKLLNL